MNTRSIESIITSARKPSRTSWCCASPTACSSRSGIAITSTIFRSQSTRSLASAIAAAFMTRPAINIDGVEMKFRYKDYFQAEPSTGYETLIYDCMIGDNILFQRADSVEAGWQAVQPFLEAWREAGSRGLVPYRA